MGCLTLQKGSSAPWSTETLFWMEGNLATKPEESGLRFSDRTNICVIACKRSWQPSALLLKRVTLASVHPMSMSWHDIGYTEGQLLKARIWPASTHNLNLFPQAYSRPTDGKISKRENRLSTHVSERYLRFPLFAAPIVILEWKMMTFSLVYD